MRYCIWEPNKVLQYDGVPLSKLQLWNVDCTNLVIQVCTFLFQEKSKRAQDDGGPDTRSPVSPGKQAKGGVAKKARLVSPTKDVSHQQVEPVRTNFYYWMNMAIVTYSSGTIDERVNTWNILNHNTAVLWFRAMPLFWFETWLHVTKKWFKSNCMVRILSHGPKTEPQWFEIWTRTLKYHKMVSNPVHCGSRILWMVLNPKHVWISDPHCIHVYHVGLAAWEYL